MMVAEHRSARKWLRVAFGVEVAYLLIALVAALLYGLFG